MRDLIRAEWFKLVKSTGFKVLLICNGATVFTTLLLLVVGAKGTGYNSLIIDLTYVLHHAVVGYLFAAVFLCGEFSNRNFGMSLLCGYSRRTVFLSKALVFLFGQLLLFLTYTGITTIIMSLGNGFGKKFTMDIFLLLICGILGYMTMGTVTVLIATITRKTILAIGIGLGSTYALMWLETNIGESRLPLLRYTYIYQIGQLESWGEGFSPGIFLVVTLITIILSLAVATFVFDRTELK